MVLRSRYGQHFYDSINDLSLIDYQSLDCNIYRLLQGNIYSHIDGNTSEE